jgi:ABC-type multidrug transport system fused ATPase/permease subunit
MEQRAAAPPATRTHAEPRLVTQVAHEARAVHGAAHISLDGVSVKYGDFTAVRDVSFDVPRNEITALIGPAGAASPPCCGPSTG